MVRTPADSRLVLGAGVSGGALALLGGYLVARAERGSALDAWGGAGSPAFVILVGVAAGIGYALGSWIAAATLERRVLWAIVALQIGTWLAAHATVDAANAARGLSSHAFRGYVGTTSRASVAAPEFGQAAGVALGATFGARALEIAIYVLSGLAGPLLFRRPHCPQCRAHLRSRRVALLPASVASAGSDAGDRGISGERESAADRAFAVAHGEAMMLLKLAEEHRTAEFFERALRCRAHERAAAGSLLRIELRLENCPRCYGGRLCATRLAGHGRRMTRSQLAAAPLSSVTVQQIGGLN